MGEHHPERQGHALENLEEKNLFYRSCQSHIGLPRYVYAVILSEAKDLGCQANRMLSVEFPAPDSSVVSLLQNDVLFFFPPFRTNASIPSRFIKENSPLPAKMSRKG